MNLFNQVSKLNFWVGVIVVLIVWRWVENMVPAVARITRPKMPTATNG